MIREAEYKQRRTKLLHSLKNNSIALLTSATPKVRSNDTEFSYRQESNFYYLSGFKEDNSAVVFIKEKKKVKTVLFVYKKDSNEELWNGKRLGKKKAKKLFDVDEVYLIDEFEEFIKSLAMQFKHFYFDFTQKNSKEFKTLEKLSIENNHNLTSLVGMQRLIKSPAEIALVKKALSITTQAHHNAMSIQKVGLYEYELQAEFEYIFKKNGAYSDAYTSIVAGGDNANTLHYIENSQRLKKGELVLIDAGCEYDYYASDITRTIPIDGVFTSAQKELYELVLEVQEKIIKMIQPKVLRSTLQKETVSLLVDGLLELGIMKGSKKKIIKKESYKSYYPHGIGHWMGLDVHDASPYKDDNSREIALKEGMLLTIEPALYMNKVDKKIPKKYRGIGIRIEDNILVTKDGYENLSEGIVKSVEEIELKVKG